MKTFEFAIIASGLNPEAEDYEARFYEAGCDDATISFQKGYTIVDFARDAESIEEAITSAIKDVTVTGAHIERVEPDPLVSLAEIAARTGLTRAAVSNYAKGSRGAGFPPPVARITSESPLWSWAAVTAWLYRRRRVTKAVACEAKVFEAANEALSDGDPDLGARLKQRLRQVEPAL